MACLLDPSSPGVSKQMMLDWMHINHPKIPIRPRIDPVSLAQLVRSVQPEYFPDPDSDAAAHKTPSASGIDPSISTNQPTRTTSETRTTSTSRYPKLQSLQDHQDLKPFEPPTPPFFKLNTNGRQGKRVASSEVKESAKSTELGSEVRRISLKTSKKKKITHSSQSTNKPTNSTGASIHESIQPSSPGHLTSNKPLTFEDNEKDLKDLHDSLAMPALPLPGAITVTKRNAKKPPPIPDRIEPRIVSQKAADSESAEIKDLIDFSDTDCMDIGNQVLGKDIPPISPNTVFGKKRSGVDVFKEERGREERICRIESSITQILEEVGQLSADVLQAKRQLEVHAHKIQVLEKDQEALKKTAQVTSPLHPKVIHLESRVDTLRCEVDMDHNEIVTHGHILEKLMASDEEEDESSE